MVRDANALKNEFKEEIMSLTMTILIYLASTATMTMMGVIYWMAIENMQPTGERREFSTCI